MDSKGLQDTATVRIDVQDSNDRPIVADSKREVSENAEVEGLVGSVVVFSDEDLLQAHKFQIISGNDNTAFAIAEDTGAITVKSQVLDYETQDSYKLTVLVTDDGIPFSPSQTPSLHRPQVSLDLEFFLGGRRCAQRGRRAWRPAADSKRRCWCHFLFNRARGAWGSIAPLLV